MIYNLQVINEDEFNKLNSSAIAEAIEKFQSATLPFHDDFNNENGVLFVFVSPFKRGVGWGNISQRLNNVLMAHLNPL